MIFKDGLYIGMQKNGLWGVVQAEGGKLVEFLEEFNDWDEAVEFMTVMNTDKAIYDRQLKTIILHTN